MTQSANHGDDVVERLGSHLSGKLACQRPRSCHHKSPRPSWFQRLRHIDQEHGVLLRVEPACDQKLVTAGPRPGEHILERDEIGRSHQ